MGGIGSSIGALVLWTIIGVLVISLALASIIVFRRKWGYKPARLKVLEVFWVAFIVAFWTYINIASLSWTPVPLRFSASGESQVIEVEAFMWGYELSVDKVESGVPVVFKAWTRDTMHSLAIYSPDGRLLVTVMLMPGEVEVFRITFEEPGTYIIMCLEYCGDGHPFMRTTLEVV